MPLDFGGTQTGILLPPYDALKKKLGLNTTSEISNRILGLAHVEEVVLQRFEVDFRHVSLNTPTEWTFELLPDDSFYDVWGTRWRRPKGGYYYDPIEYPLSSASLNALEAYPWPNALDPGWSRTAEESTRILHNHTDFAVEIGFPGPWERSWFLVGLERWMMSLIDNLEFAEALLDQVLDYQLRLYSTCLDRVGAYVDIVTFWDDYGAQVSTLISPYLWRRLVKPRLAALVKCVRRRTNAHIGLHSCGSIRALMDDLVEIGIQVLNPIQVSAAGMKPQELKQRYGRHLTFWGAIDTQSLLSRASATEVTQTTIEIINTLAPDGGYILAATHNIQPEVPPENVIAMYDCARSAGRYPLAVGDMRQEGVC